MTKFSDTCNEILYTEVKESNADISISVQDFRSLIFQKTSVSQNVRDQFRRDISIKTSKKKNLWSFIILSLSSATAKENAKKKQKQKEARYNYETETPLMTFMAKTKGKKGLRLSVL